MMFCKQINKLVKSVNGDKMKFTTKKMLTNEMTTNFNMFCLLMENIIMGNLNGTVIVTIKIFR